MATVTLVARLPGWNPPTLRPDDLIYGAVVKSAFVDLLTAPIHVAPGVLVVLQLFYSVLPDPEWSLQLFPFVCGLAAVPAMTALVGSLTRDGRMAALAGAATALNPLLAHYSVTVRQYSLDFLMTALFLLAAARLLAGEGGIDRRRLTWTAVWGALAIPFSVTSVFASGPTIAVGTACAIWRHFRAGEPGWRLQQCAGILASAAGYGAVLIVAYVLLQERSNPLIRDYWDEGFMPLDVAGAREFLAAYGRSVLERSLPLWETVGSAAPAISTADPDGRAMQTASWPLPLLGIGLAGLLWRRRTRRFGLVVVMFYASCMAASALQVYPFGAGRPDIFAFPAGICLFAAGVDAVVQRWPGAGACRWVAAGIVVLFAIVRPVQTPYAWTADEATLVRHLSAAARPEDGIFLSHGGAFLAAFYGRWPVVVTETELVSYGAEASLVRNNTLVLPFSRSQDEAVSKFLEEGRPERIWYLAYSTLMGREGVLGTLRRQGFLVQRLQDAGTGTLYVALDYARPR
ncbi:MAG: hypothetical protein OXF93_18030 [Acidobacteria bacterium]|nr:hypothetical protein [Acidobacteriota bacterium]